MKPITFIRFWTRLTLCAEIFLVTVQFVVVEHHLLFPKEDTYEQYA